MLWAYLGPDTFLPLTSIAAAVVGGFLMFGRYLKDFVRGALRRGSGPAATTTTTTTRARAGRLRGEPSTSPPDGPHPHVNPASSEGESLPSRR